MLQIILSRKKGKKGKKNGLWSSFIKQNLKKKKLWHTLIKKMLMQWEGRSI